MSKTKGMNSTFPADPAREIELLRKLAEFEAENAELESRLLERTSELQRSRQQISDILNSFKDGFYALDKEGRFLFINPRAAENAGYQPEELVGRNIWEKFPQLRGSLFEEKCREVLEQQQAVFFEMPGIIRQLDYQISIYPSNEGVIVYWTDISERRRIERDLRQAYDLLETVTQGTEVIIAVVDTDFRFIYFNKAYAEEIQRLSGKQPAIGMSMVELFAHMPEQQQVVLETWSPTLQGERSERIVEFGDPGKYRRIYRTQKTPLWDADGKVIGAGEVASDVTKQVQAEEALHESEKRYRTLFNGMTEGFALHRIICDEQGTPIDYHFLDINPAFERLTGLQREQVVGKDLSQIPQLQNDDPIWVERYGKVALTGEPVHFENYSPALNRYYEVFAYCPQPGQFAVLFMDITERKRSEDALSLRLDLREYAVSHKLEEFFQRTIDVAEQLTSSQIGFFHTLDADQKTLTLQAWSTNTLENMCKAEGQGAHYPVEQAGVWVECIAQRRPVIHNDYASLPNRKGLPEGHSPVIRELVVPIIRDELIVAVLGVGNKPVDYDERDTQTIFELANLAWEFVSSKHAELQIENLARFPDENPNPVMRIDREGKLLYANQASRPLLEVWSCKAGQPLPQPWRDLAIEAFSADIEKTTEVQCGDIIFSILFVPITGAGYTNLYGRDVTEQVKATEALLKARTELEARVRERTQALEISNEQLLTEISERTKAEEALHSAYAYNRSLIDASLDPLLTIMPNGKIGDVNIATESVTGYSREELIGTDFDAYFTDPDQARAGYQQAFELGEVRDYELEIRHKGGFIRSVLYNASTFRDESGEIAGIFAAARDITQRKQTEQELQQQEALLRAMMENLPVGVWITDASGKILQGNPAGLSIWAGAGSAGTERFGNYKGWWASNGKRIKTDEWAVARAVRKGQTSINEEIEIECFDGTHKIILNSAIPLRDAQQAIMGAIVVNQDITETKQAQKELDSDRRRLLLLSQSERAQRLFAESLTQTMLVLNSSLDLNEVLDCILEQIQNVIPFRSANVALLEDKLVSQVRQRGGENMPPDYNILQESFPLDAFPLWEKLAERRQVMLIDDLAVEPEPFTLAGYEWVRAYLGAALQSGAGVVGFINLFSDHPGFFSQEAADRLTAFANQAALAIQNARLYRDLERSLDQEQSMRAQLVQAEKFAAMGRMLASVAHELNNPLQTIQNCLYLTQQDTPGDSPIQEYLEMAFSEIRRLSRMVAQLRELYRPRSAMVVQPNNLCQILKEAHALLAPHLQNLHVSWKQAPGPDVLIVNCDSDQIKQVFINIGMNAIEAMQPQGGSLAVEAIRSEDGCQAGVVFRDTGPGMPSEILHNLFEPFFTTKSSGLGLGLSICYELVQRHNGTITAENMENEGSVFTIWLPLAEDQDGI